MSKIKVASLFASLKIGGGVEKVQANLSLGLNDIGYDFYHIICEDKLPRNDYKGKIISLDSPFILGFGFKKIFSLIINSYKVSRICKKEKIDILIGQGDYFFMVSGLAKIFGFKGKNIAVVHTTIGIWPKYINFLLLVFLRLHDKIVLTSKDEYDTFINKYGFTNNGLELIYNSIDVTKFELLKNEMIDDISFDKFTFINIARLTYQKGQDRLLKAFDIFNGKYKNSQLIILGEGELREDYIKLKNNLKSGDNIHFLGNKTNFYKYLYKSDCFILSSNFEGFPIILIEAICMGKPIISTYCETGPKELFDINNSFDDLNNDIFKTEYGYLTSLKNNSINNLFIAMELYFKEQDIKYETSDFIKRFSFESNIANWNNLFK